ncbi:MAG TPA: cytochrome P450, partial [Acidimicrobiia bacterium]|nr:cytochrome P450 [Acidimicrobiia bacterium]
GGVTIGAGDFVMVSVAAANRDPDAYPDPDRFDVTRENARTHLTFAQGPHHCVGLHLARAETRATLAAAFARLPGLRLAGTVELEGTVFRKPKAVPAAWLV